MIILNHRLACLFFVLVVSIRCVFAQSSPCGPLQANAVVDCINGTAQLSVATGYNSFTWSPSAGLSNDTIPNPVASLSGTYSVTATYQGPNLVVNPDFAAGNTGFTSGMNFTTVYSPCNYWVGNQWFSTYFPGLLDHTPTNDNMFMMLDGCTTPTMIWEEANFTIVPGADYQFSFWATEAGVTAPTFEIHFIGNVTGNTVVATIPGIPSPNNSGFVWDQYMIPSWNAGANTSVTIQIINLATQSYGVDFGMDDFDFHRYCSSTDSVQVILPVPLSLGPDISLCDLPSITLDAGPGNSYIWSTGATTQTISLSVPGTYWVIVDNGVCDVTDTIVLYNTLTQPVELGEDISLCDFFSVELDAGSADSYLWSTGENSQSIAPASAGTYWVTATYGNCTSSDTIVLTGVLGESMVYIPNTVTPDGDVLNDVFFVYGTDMIDFRLRIFDRWGELIFESTDMAEGWDGTFKGEIVQQDTYVYVVDYKTTCDGTTRKKIGHVNVIR